MSSIQTDEETVETVESAQLERQILGQQEETATNPSSFSASIRKTLQRFVRWIDGVDVDGQEYWN
jgi:hypothetical protein